MLTFQAMRVGDLGVGNWRGGGRWGGRSGTCNYLDNLRELFARKIISLRYLNGRQLFPALLGYSKKGYVGGIS